MSITESSSNFDNLENMSVGDILVNMNAEDKSVPLAVERIIPSVEALVIQIVERMKHGGRLFYIGAGTSGRLGILDASECPPTYGVPDNMIIGLIAGGDKAIRRAVENAEDDVDLAWKDLKSYDINEKDSVLGIAASGRTPYVIGGVRKAKENGILTGSIACNMDSPLSREVDYPIEVIVGPEFVTGSTRMKSGTAQKLLLNMISTSVMIKLGRVKGNKMVDMQLSNEKLVKRGVKMIVDELNIPQDKAKMLLEKHKSVRNVLISYK